MVSLVADALIVVFMQDKAMEVSLDFDGEAEAPPPRQQDSGQQQEQKDEAEQREDVSGSVDLKEGGTIEDKRWAGDDGEKEEEEGKCQQGDKKQEDIETEGGVRQGGVEMEGAKTDDEPHGNAKDPRDTKQPQPDKGDQQGADGDLDEDEGRLEVGA